MGDSKIHFRYGSDGALVCDMNIPNVTQYIADDDLAYWYGGRYFVGESMTKSAAKKIAELLGGVLDEEEQKHE